jgi:hypothetical protein
MVPMPFVGEELDQQGVGHPAVDDVRGADAGIDRVGASPELRDHARADALMSDPLAKLGRGERGTSEEGSLTSSSRPGAAVR